MYIVLIQNSQQPVGQPHLSSFLPSYERQDGPALDRSRADGRPSPPLPRNLNERRKTNLYPLLFYFIARIFLPCPKKYLGNCAFPFYFIQWGPGDDEVLGRIQVVNRAEPEARLL